MNQTKDRKMLIGEIIMFSIMIGVIFYFFIFRSLANHRPLTKDISFSTLQLDEDVYGNTTFDSSNLNLRTILDKDVNQNNNHVISISFVVGGNKDNDTEKPIYDIALADLKVDCELLSPYVKWKLYKNGNEISSGSLDYKFDTIKEGRLVLTPIQQDLKEYSDDKSTYDYYDFYLWLSDSCQENSISTCDSSLIQNSLLGKKITGKIEVELYSGPKKLLNRSGSETLDTSTCMNELSKKDDEDTTSKE